MSKNTLESPFNNIIDGIQSKDSHVSYDISSLPVFLLIFSILYAMIMTILFFVIYYNIFSIFVVGISIITIFYMLMRSRKLFNYIILFVPTFIITGIFYHLGPIHTDDSSARYLISALIQSEAAILAIVVSLSLVAVQQTSSSYSARVISVFKKSLDFSFLMAIYISAIIYGSWILKKIPHSNYNFSLEMEIWIVYSLSIFALLALWRYIVNTLEMFKPTKLIELLSEDMRFYDINNAIKLEKNYNTDESGRIQPVDDSIQPIVDVLQGSMKNHDYESTRYGLKIIEQKAYGILNDEKCDDNYKPEIASRIIGHVETIGVVAVNNQMEKTVEHIASILGKFGTFMITDNVNYISSDLISSLKKIGKIASKQEIEDATDKVIFSLQDVAKTAIDNNLKDVTQNVMMSIKEIGISNATSSNISYFTLYSVIKSLENIMMEVTKKWGKECKTTILHGMIALIAISSKLTKSTNIADNDKQSLRVAIIGIFSSITQITIDLGLIKETNHACISLKIIGIRAADDDIYITKDALKNLNYIRSYMIDEQMNTGIYWSKKQINGYMQELENIIKTKSNNAPPKPPIAS